MKDMPGFPNVACFDTEWERDLFISNVEDIPDVLVQKLDVIIREGVLVYPLRLVFTDDPTEPVVAITDTPF